MATNCLHENFILLFISVHLIGSLRVDLHCIITRRKASGKLKYRQTHAEQYNNIITETVSITGLFWCHYLLTQ